MFLQVRRKGTSGAVLLALGANVGTFLRLVLLRGTRQVARYADASNTGPGNFIGNAWGLEEMLRKHEVLRSHCEEVGRPPDSILRTHVNFMMKLGRDESTSVDREQDTGSGSGEP